MSFLPHVYKSKQDKQSGTINPATNTGTIAISAVNTSYTAILATGAGAGGSIFGGFDGSGLFAWTLNSSTQIQWDRGYSNAGNSVSAEAYCTVLEFNPQFLRQTIHTFFQNATFAHGLTLGPFAYILYGGSYSAQDQSGTDSAVISAVAQIVGANVVFSADGGAFIRGFIVDPF